ncbi:hypothetical protein SSPNP10_13755 [Streptomyces sp. NP10]|uniref:hypothetical protein n=1 Tax=Streptomyces sp. NP10 TaxID=1141731 RepID=UPI000F86C764|nr:hypothetical protein [Streptomyces sp. NP10]RUP67585.1 hypothetical protein SSPNP10_13755 [Streptomyces sp. NP10]
MSKKPPRPGEGPSRFKGEGQHGWSPDVDEESQQPNPSAHRSFHDTYAPEPDRPRKRSTEEEKRASLEGTPSESATSRGKDSDMRDTGRRGRSGRPSGEKDASAHTGVDPQERKGSDPTH